MVFFTLSISPAAGQLQPGDELQIRDSMLHHPLRIVHHEKYYYPYWDKIRYYADGSRYQWIEYIDAKGRKWKEGLSRNGYYEQIGYYRYYDTTGTLIKTYDYTNEQLVYYHGYDDRFHFTIDSLRAITDSILTDRFGRGFFTAHVHFDPYFYWYTKKNPYGRFPEYPDTVPRSLHLRYYVFGGEMEYGFPIEFRLENLQLHETLEVDDELISINGFRPHPVKVDYASAIKTLRGYGYTDAPDLMYDSLSRDFTWRSERLTDTMNTRVRTIRINATTGKYRVNVYGYEEPVTIGCGFISEIDTTCYYTYQTQDTFKVYDTGGMHISVPQDFYLDIRQDYVYYAYTLTNGRDSLLCNTIIRYAMRREDNVSDRIEAEGKPMLRRSLIAQEVKGWLSPDQLCKKIPYVWLDGEEGNYTLVIQVVEPGVWMGGGDRITQSIAIVHADPYRISDWEPIIRRLYFY